jgi:ribosomal protein S27E
MCAHGVANHARYSQRVARKRSWIQEERRRTLGDWVALCLGCGHVQRYFEDSEDRVPLACPQCGEHLLARCPACEARIASAFAVECEECGTALRPDEGFGSRIRKPGR